MSEWRQKRDKIVTKLWQRTVIGSLMNVNGSSQKRKEMKIARISRIKLKRIKKIENSGQIGWKRGTA